MFSRKNVLFSGIMEKQNVTEKLELVYNRVLRLEGFQEKTSNDLITLANTLIKLETAINEKLRKLETASNEALRKLKTASNEDRVRIAQLERVVQSRAQGLKAPEANSSLLKPDLKI